MSDIEVLEVMTEMLNGNPPEVVGWFCLFNEVE